MDCKIENLIYVLGGKSDIFAPSVYIIKHNMDIFISITKGYVFYHRYNDKRTIEPLTVENLMTIYDKMQMDIQRQTTRKYS